MDSSYFAPTMLFVRVITFGVLFSAKFASSKGTLQQQSNLKMTDKSLINQESIAIATNQQTYVRTSNGSLGEYSFLRSECLLGNFPNSLGGTILPYLSAKTSIGSCLKGNGLASSTSTYQSSRNVSQFITAVSSKRTFTIEMWYQLNTTATVDAEIFSFGSEGKTLPYFQISQVVDQTSLNGYNLFITATSSRIDTTNLLVVNANGQNNLLANKTNHIVITIVTHVTGSRNFISAAYSMNGVYSGYAAGYGSTLGSYDVSLWDKRTVLQLYRQIPVITSGVATLPPNYAGNIYLLAFFKRALTAAEITQNYMAKIKRSLVVVFSQSVTVQQNGEVGDHSLLPSYYSSSSQIAINALPVIELQAYSADDSYSSPNYNAAGPFMTLKVLLSSLPATTVGLFYLMDGTPLISTPTNSPVSSPTTSRSPSTPPTFSPASAPFSATFAVPRNNVTGGYYIRFRPAYGKHSIGNTSYCTFSYNAYDGVTLLPAPTAAVVSVVVSHVDVPPIPTIGLSVSVIQGQYKIFNLTGSDVDSIISGSLIVTVPSGGALHKITNKIIATKQIKLSAPSQSYPQIYGNAAYLNNSFQVAYLSNNSVSTTLIRNVTASESKNGVIGKDFFYFALQDVEGRRSVVALFSIVIYTSITVTATPIRTVVTAHNPILTLLNPLVSENNNNGILLYAADSSNIPRNIFIKIISTPLKGILYDTNTLTKTVLKSNTILSIPITTSNYNNGVMVYYTGNKGYFTTPITMFNGTLVNPNLLGIDSFQFQARTGDGTYSLPATQYVTVKNVNDRTDIDVTQIRSSSDQGFQVTPLAGLTDDKMKITITGFKITDPDHNVDIIKVTIMTSMQGLVSLNPLGLRGIDFNSQKYCNSDQNNWQCEGSGTFNSKMTFLGMPVDIESALNGLSFESVHPDVTDTVNITLYDGEGGQCLNNKLLGTGSSRSGCLMTSVSFQVTVGSLAAVTQTVIAASDTTANSLSFKVKLIAGCIGFVLVLGALRCYHLRRLSQRRLKKQQEEDDEEESKENTESDSKSLSDDWSGKKNGKLRRKLGNDDSSEKGLKVPTKVIDLDSGNTYSRKKITRKGSTDRMSTYKQNDTIAGEKTVTGGTAPGTPISTACNSMENTPSKRHSYDGLKGSPGTPSHAPPGYMSSPKNRLGHNTPNRIDFTETMIRSESSPPTSTRSQGLSGSFQRFFPPGSPGGSSKGASAKEGRVYLSNSPRLDPDEIDQVHDLVDRMGLTPPKGTVSSSKSNRRRHTYEETGNEKRHENTPSPSRENSLRSGGKQQSNLERKDSSDYIPHENVSHSPAKNWKDGQSMSPAASKYETCSRSLLTSPGRLEDSQDDYSPNKANRKLCVERSNGAGNYVRRNELENSEYSETEEYVVRSSPKSRKNTKDRQSIDKVEENYNFSPKITSQPKTRTEWYMQQQQQEFERKIQLATEKHQQQLEFEQQYPPHSTGRSHARTFYPSPEHDSPHPTGNAHHQSTPDHSPTRSTPRNTADPNVPKNTPRTTPDQSPATSQKGAPHNTPNSPSKQSTHRLPPIKDRTHRSIGVETPPKAPRESKTAWSANEGAPPKPPREDKTTRSAGDGPPTPKTPRTSQSSSQSPHHLPLESPSKASKQSPSRPTPLSILSLECPVPQSPSKHSKSSKMSADGSVCPTTPTKVQPQCNAFSPDRTPSSPHQSSSLRISSSSSFSPDHNLSSPQKASSLRISSSSPLRSSSSPRHPSPHSSSPRHVSPHHTQDHDTEYSPEHIHDSFPHLSAASRRGSLCRRGSSKKFEPYLSSMPEHEVTFSKEDKKKSGIKDPKSPKISQDGRSLVSPMISPVVESIIKSWGVLYNQEGPSTPTKSKPSETDVVIQSTPPKKR